MAIIILKPEANSGADYSLLRSRDVFPSIIPQLCYVTNIYILVKVSLYISTLTLVNIQLTLNWDERELHVLAHRPGSCDCTSVIHEHWAD